MLKLLMQGSGETEIIVSAFLLIICWNIENVAGLAMGYKKWKHAYLNARFILITVIPQFFMGLLLVKTMQWSALHHFGILYGIPYMSHPVLLFIASFVLLDFGEYIYHVIMHKTNMLWKFHAVHHCDITVDVSTTLREHPCETVIRNVFTLVWIFFSGAFLWTFFLRQIIQVISNLLAHMNYRLPEKIDAVVAMVFITPNLHHVHHHYQKPYTDCNYGDVLSVWDRMFGTFKKLPKEKVIFGLDTCLDKKTNSAYISLLKMPFVPDIESNGVTQ